MNQFNRADWLTDDNQRGMLCAVKNFQEKVMNAVNGFANVYYGYFTDHILTCGTLLATV